MNNKNISFSWLRKNKGKEVRCYFSLPVTFGLK